MGKHRSHKSSNKIYLQMISECGQHFSAAHMNVILWTKCCGKGFGTEFSPTPHKVAEWVNQTVGYIKQKSDEHANIKNGYLVVFDARLNDITTDYDQMISVNVLEEDLKPFFYRFKKINDFRVKNTTPR